MSPWVVKKQNDWIGKWWHLLKIKTAEQAQSQEITAAGGTFWASGDRLKTINEHKTSWNPKEHDEAFRNEVLCRQIPTRHPEIFQIIVTLHKTSPVYPHGSQQRWSPNVAAAKTLLSRSEAFPSLWIWRCDLSSQSISREIWFGIKTSSKKRLRSDLNCISCCCFFAEPKQMHQRTDSFWQFGDKRRRCLMAQEITS